MPLPEKKKDGKVTNTFDMYQKSREAACVCVCVCGTYQLPEALDELHHQRHEARRSDFGVVLHTAAHESGRRQCKGTVNGTVPLTASSSASLQLLQNTAWH